MENGEFHLLGTNLANKYSRRLACLLKSITDSWEGLLAPRLAPAIKPPYRVSDQLIVDVALKPRAVADTIPRPSQRRLDIRDIFHIVFHVDPIVADATRSILCGFRGFKTHGYIHAVASATKS